MTLIYQSSILPDLTLCIPVSMYVCTVPLTEINFPEMFSNSQHYLCKYCHLWKYYPFLRPILNATFFLMHSLITQLLSILYAPQIFYSLMTTFISVRGLVLQIISQSVFLRTLGFEIIHKIHISFGNTATYTHFGWLTTCNNIKDSEKVYSK